MKKTVRETLADMAVALNKYKEGFATLSVDPLNQVQHEIETCSRATKDYEFDFIPEIAVLEKEADIDSEKLDIIAINLRLLVAATGNIDTHHTARSIIKLIIGKAR